MMPGVALDAITVNAVERPEGPDAVCTYTCHVPATSVTPLTVTLVALTTFICDAANSVHVVHTVWQNHTSIGEPKPVPVIVPPNGWFAVGVVVHV